MNLAIRGLEANLGKHNADSFHDDQHKTLKANFILANRLSMFLIMDWKESKMMFVGDMVHHQLEMLTTHGYSICFII